MSYSLASPPRRQIRASSMWLSHCHCHTVNVTMSMSHRHCHTINVTLSHIQCHTVNVTLTFSHSPTVLLATVYRCRIYRRIGICLLLMSYIHLSSVAVFAPSHSPSSSACAVNDHVVLQGEGEVPLGEHWFMINQSEPSFWVVWDTLLDFSYGTPIQTDVTMLLASAGLHKLPVMTSYHANSSTCQSKFWGRTKCVRGRQLLPHTQSPLIRNSLL